VLALERRLLETRTAREGGGVWERGGCEAAQGGAAGAAAHGGGGGFTLWGGEVEAGGAAHALASQAAREEGSEGRGWGGGGGGGERDSGGREAVPLAAGGREAVPLATAVARYWFKVLAYKDEIEVARLHLTHGPSSADLDRQVLFFFFASACFICEHNRVYYNLACVSGTKVHILTPEELLQYESGYQVYYNLAPPGLAPKDATTGTQFRSQYSYFCTSKARVTAKKKGGGGGTNTDT
jgi:hypothetical protein